MFDSWQLNKNDFFFHGDRTSAVTCDIHFSLSVSLSVCLSVFRITLENENSYQYLV